MKRIRVTLGKSSRASQGSRSTAAWSWRRAALVWVLTFLVMALGFSIFGRGWFDAYRLSRDGVTTQGVVTKLVPDNHNGCDFTYTVGARTYATFQTTCADTHVVGDPITVTYLPAKPSVNTVNSPNQDLVNAAVVSVLVSTMFAIGLGSGRPANRFGITDES